MAIIAQLLPIITAVCQVLGALAIIATVAVRFLPKEAKAASGFVGLVLKVFHFLPTLGINPQTKALEDALADLQPKA